MRSAYREYFLRGLTTLDDPRVLSAFVDPDLACPPAGREVADLLSALRLPIDERGHRRAALRAEWFACRDNPLELDDILGHENQWRPAQQS